MSVLVLNAGTASPIALAVSQAGENAPTEIGTITPAFAGPDRSSVRGVKRNFGSMTTYVDTPTKESIVSLLKWGRQIPCSGDVLGNIQTQCTVRYTAVPMVPGLSGFWTVTLTLSEVQPSTMLLRYSPGDTITGESLTRSTIGYSVNAAGVLVSNAINVKRDNHYVGGVRGLLLEGGATDSLISTTDFSNAAWVKTTMGITSAIADPMGGTAAQTLTASGANAAVDQVLAAGSSIPRTNSIWLRRRTGSGTINLIKPDNTTYTPIALTANWTRFFSFGAAGTSRKFTLQIVTNGDAVDAFYPQIDDTPFATSEIPTTSIAVPRGADLYSLPFTAPPGELTVYLRFTELGTIQSNVVLLDICNAAEATPYFRILPYQATHAYRAEHNNGTASAISTLPDTPALGDTVEIMARLFGDGSVDITQSRNGAVATAGAQAAANALANVWSGQLAWLNSEGNTAPGFTHIQSLKIVAGMRSLTEMRVA